MKIHQYQILEDLLAEQIVEGRLNAGDRLPSVRVLCERHDLAKGTVLHALSRLEARGLVAARPRSGYYVTERGAPVSATPRPAAPVNARVSPLLMDLMQNGAAFDLVPGAGGENTQGLELLNRSINRVMRRQRGQSHLYYDDPSGSVILREQLAMRYLRRGCKLTYEDFIVTSGCQNALFLALMATCKAGDVVAVESPGFYGALQLLEQLQLKVIEIPSSPLTGMSVDALQQAAEKWPVKACIVSPCYSTPAGAVMPDPARKQFLQLAEQQDFAVIEDDIYADTALSYTPDPLKKLDQSGRVILCSSFSKSLSRDLRIGWISGGRWQQALLQLKLVTQLASPLSVQNGLAEFISNGDYDSHLKRQQKCLRQQSEHLLNHVRDWTAVTNVEVPEGGLTLWIELEPDQDTSALFSKLKNEGVFIAPGALFSTKNKFSNYLRLSFAHPWNDHRQKALSVIGKLLS
ncbi:transcriptional regulator, GntR family [Thalassolituus maritimus]|uniref:Transcriptional regulator, GntR family n=1 Tax=Thalassolituus maritimus TaxID=484498 RepID=A0A1N7NQF4_9GAMM|nr:PLP-dependent aminotransferase family protein [Thalassolituus maritimus]SIT00574.1 transcriptional regulator, GntR family [Thalassolituus maritimus]